MALALLKGTAALSRLMASGSVEERDETHKRITSAMNDSIEVPPDTSQRPASSNPLERLPADGPTSKGLTVRPTVPRRRNFQPAHETFMGALDLLLEGIGDHRGQD